MSRDDGTRSGSSQSERTTTAAVSYSGQAVRGTLWSTIPIAIGKMASLATTLMLGFFLEPSEFGLAWFVISAAGLATGLHVLAASDVLMSMPKSFAAYAGPIQRLALAAAAAEVLVVAALALAVQYWLPDRAGATVLMLFVALRPVIDAMTIVPLARLRLDLAYRKVSIIDGATALIGPSGAVILALAGFGPAAIVLPPMVLTAARASLYWKASGFQMKTWATRRTRALVRRFLFATFGSYLNGAFVLLETAVLGALSTERTAGLFAFALGIANQANVVISFHVAGALHPIFSHLRDSRERQVDGLLRSSALLATLLVPLLLVQAAIAGPAARQVWGHKWEDAIPAFMAISVSQCFIVAQWPSSLALKAQGRFRGFVKLQVLMIAVSGTLAVVAATRGSAPLLSLAGTAGFPLSEHAATALATGVTGAACLAVFGPITLWLAIRHAGGSMGQAVRVLWTPWPAGMVAASLAGWGARQIDVLALGTPASLSAIGAIALIAWIGGTGATVVTHASLRRDAFAIFRSATGASSRGAIK